MTHICLLVTLVYLRQKPTMDAFSSFLTNVDIKRCAKTRNIKRVRAGTANAKNMACKCSMCKKDKQTIVHCCGTCHKGNSKQTRRNAVRGWVESHARLCVSVFEKTWHVAQTIDGRKNFPLARRVDGHGSHDPEK